MNVEMVEDNCDRRWESLLSEEKLRKKVEPLEKLKERLWEKRTECDRRWQEINSCGREDIGQRLKLESLVGQMYAFDAAVDEVDRLIYLMDLEEEE